MIEDMDDPGFVDRLLAAKKMLEDAEVPSEGRMVRVCVGGEWREYGPKPGEYRVLVFDEDLEDDVD